MMDETITKGSRECRWQVTSSQNTIVIPYMIDTEPFLSTKRMLNVKIVT